MDRKTAPVNQKRKYDSTRRRAQAGQTRRDILGAARGLFLSRGYVATTIVEVATESGVSVETVYKAFGNKPKLVKAVVDHGLEGSGPITTGELARRVSAEERDPRARLRAFGGFVAEVAPRVSSLALLVRDAATADPELALVWDQLNEERLASMAAHAQHLHDDGHLRPDVSVEEARDILWSYCSPELYDLLVQRRGWNVERFGRWVGESYIAALLPV